jgi:peptidoglycan/xylan/chitin deacetylase (PgdA/CDA1 family)
VIRRIVRSAASTRAGARIVDALDALDGGGSHALPVLTYHRILDHGARPSLHRLSVSPAAFEEQLDALMRRRQFVSLADVIDASRGALRLPRRSLLLTFDDAYDDFERTAWPILASRSLPAALFVPTGYPDRSERWFWWDQLNELLATPSPVGSVPTPLGELPIRTDRERRRAFADLRDHFKTLPVRESMAAVEGLTAAMGAPPARNEVLGWDSLRRLAAAGVTLAPHSRSHPLLTTTTDDELRDELSGSLDDLRREVGDCPPALAYPSGAHDARVVAATDAAGYAVAFTTKRGVNDLRRGRWLTLRRINVGSRTPAALLQAQAGRWMTLVGG